MDKITKKQNIKMFEYSRFIFLLKLSIEQLNSRYSKKELFNICFKIEEEEKIFFCDDILQKNIFGFSKLDNKFFFDKIKELLTYDDYKYKNKIINNSYCIELIITNICYDNILFFKYTYIDLLITRNKFKRNYLENINIE